MLSSEEWLAIPGTSGRYEVSSVGRVRTWEFRNRHGVKRLTGMLVGVACEFCNQERLAAFAGIVTCLACGKRATEEAPLP